MTDSQKNNKEIDHLASELLYYNDLYYSGKETIPNESWDLMREKLKSLAPNHPVLYFIENKSKSSDTVDHLPPMLSLDKTRDVKKIIDWTQVAASVMSVKVDGMSLKLQYQDGKLIAAASRSNGHSGENLTSKIFYIDSIPQKLKNNKFIDSITRDGLILEIRGELYFATSEFEKIKEHFDSIRNAVAGVMLRKDPDESRSLLKSLSFFAYDAYLLSDGKKEVVSFEKYGINSYQEILSLLNDLSFSCPEYMLLSTYNDEIINEFFDRKRDYAFDGLVFRYDDLSYWNNLGQTAHHPRGSVAFKRASESSETTLEGIEIAVGRTGKISYRAKVSPVRLSDATVGYATLHSAGFIENGGYHPGCRVKITRSGEVIPYIIEKIKDSEDLNQANYRLPQKCVCGFDLRREGPHLYCDSLSCEGKKLQNYCYFLSELGVKGVSEKTVEKLIDAGLIKKKADFFKLKASDIERIPGFKSKSSLKIIEAIESCKTIKLEQFLSSLGIPGIGNTACAEIKKHFRTLDRILAITVDDLIVIDGWAQKSAESFVEGLKSSKDEINALMSYMTIEAESEESTKYLHGKSFCITGTLSMPRKKIEEIIVKNGGLINFTVNESTSFLICNEDSGSSKSQKAKKIGVRIISEADFLAMLDKIGKI